MSSQQNEAMNRSIMRYAPKEKKYAQTVALTSRINISIGVDCVGHAKCYERLFGAMGFRMTALPFSDLQRMWRKKEYSRIYLGLQKVKKHWQLTARNKMIDGVAKMELDSKEEGWWYASSIHVEVECDIERDTEGEQPAKKKARQVNNPLTNTQEGGCKCGADYHKRVTSKNCPWKGWSKTVVSQNYERRLTSLKKMSEGSEPACATVASCSGSTENIVLSTSNYLAPSPTVILPGVPTEKIVQLTIKYSGANANQKGYDTEFWNPMVCDTFTHVTHPVGLLHRFYSKDSY
jgi:hypothetical protein